MIRISQIKMELFHKEEEIKKAAAKLLHLDSSVISDFFDRKTLYRCQKKAEALLCIFGLSQFKRGK